VLLYDLSAGAAAADNAGAGVLSEAQQVLTHQLQQQVRALCRRQLVCAVLVLLLALLRGIMGCGVALLPVPFVR
jgi:NAD-dependent oxidoreductase involved in siderophore biosynthesis